MKITIYLVKNDFNGLVYVGQTHNSLERRFSGHKSADSRLGRAIRYHGEEHFKILKIDEADTQEHADKLEREYIKEFDAIKNGYNLRAGGVLDYGEEYEPKKQIKHELTGNKVHFIF